jgi:hypothetical protein
MARWEKLLRIIHNDWISCRQNIILFYLYRLQPDKCQYQFSKCYLIPVPTVMQQFLNVLVKYISKDINHYTNSKKNDTSKSKHFLSKKGIV